MKMPGVHPVCRGDRRTASVDVTDARNALVARLSGGFLAVLERCRVYLWYND